MTTSRFDWLGKAFFEAALIVLAVVLGFLVNSWREDAQAREQSKAALERIIAELRANRENVDTLYRYQTPIADGIRPMLGDPPQAPIIQTVFVVADRGLGDLSLRDEAWTTAINRDSLSQVDFETVQKIAQVYGLADRGVASSWTALLSLFGERDAFQVDNEGIALTRFSFSLDNLIAQERFLIQQYDAVLLSIDPAANPEPH